MSWIKSFNLEISKYSMKMMATYQIRGKEEIANTKKNLNKNLQGRWDSTKLYRPKEERESRMVRMKRCNEGTWPTRVKIKNEMVITKRSRQNTHKTRACLITGASAERARVIIIVSPSVTIPLKNSEKHWKFNKKDTIMQMEWKMCRSPNTLMLCPCSSWNV